tara:strand:- start:513 stop:1517 length:1005 start_codon:yes stop_codon:yes gene_type:complete
MLEQAIVDARALKEAAIKNAESAVIDKYQDEVRSAMDALLEQEEGELDLGLEEEEGLDLDLGLEEEEGAELSLEAPDAFSAGEKLCACPDIDEEITIDFDSLRQEMEGEAGDEEGLDLDLGLEEEGEDEELDLVQEDLEALVKEITEELTVDLQAVGSGTIGTNDVETEEGEDFAIAGMRDDEAAEEEEEHLKAISDLTDRLDEALSKNKGLSAKVESYEKAVSQLKNKLDEINLSNAKLLYTNRVLSSASLNERQKNKLVEAIRKSGSIEETKTIFETLQDTLETKHSKAPSSLNEIVTNNRNSSPFLPRKQKLEESVDDVFSKRMRLLAGIK